MEGITVLALIIFVFMAGYFTRWLFDWRSEQGEAFEREEPETDHDAVAWKLLESVVLGDLDS